MSARGLTVIGASAGTGKTHRLTELVWSHCRPGGDTPPDGLVAVTFTTKAAAELADRIRARLFREGAAEAADRLGLAWLGTVHAVGWRLVAEHAFDAGMPLDHRMLDGEASWALHRILEHAVPEQRRATLEALGERLMIRWDTTTRRSDWMNDVFALVEGARANRIGSDALAAMARRSSDGLLAFLGPPDHERDLEAELRAAASAIVIDASGMTKGTDAALRGLDQALGEIGRGIWCGWQRIAQLQPTKAHVDAFAAVKAIAAAHLSHPRLRTDLEAYVAEAYAAAGDILEAFAGWKRAHHIIDYADMLDLALTVLDEPGVEADLRERMHMVVVDELQDSGPLQLALFARLHQLVGRSFWVGDPKQCIFEWSGADPALMDALLREVGSNGRERLTVNWRSRATLVAGCSALFSAAFATVGMAPDDVAATPCDARRADPPELAGLPPVSLVRVGTTGAIDDLADALAGLLGAPEATPVLDRQTGRVRPLAPADVCVLVRSNAECVALAQALHLRGIAATTWRRGLLATREGRLVQAALRLLVAGRDAHAEAELEALTGFEHYGADPDAARAAWLAARMGPHETRPRRFETLLEPVRDELLALSPSGVVERVYEALDVARWVARFEDPAQAVANLDALRRLARSYEAEATAKGGAATVSGLVRALDTIARAARGRGDNGARDAQHVGVGGDAVNVMTYHRSKGLEWPVVVLASLGHAEARTAFEVWAESERPPTLAAPLSGRWLRYWPWPYGNFSTGTLCDAVARSDVGREVAERERRERLRLLYVGFTRARDHLVLALPHNPKNVIVAPWLDALSDAGGKLVAIGRDTVTLAGKVRWSARWLGPGATSTRATQASAIARPPGMPPTRSARRLAPSGASPDEVQGLGGVTLVPGEVVVLGERLTLRVRGEAEATAAGLALHGFLASDDVDRAPDERRDRAAAWLHAEHAIGALEPDAMLLAGERLAAFVAERWPDALERPEIPLRAALGDPAREVGGTVDLLLEVPDGFVVIDHKSNHAADLRPAARGYATQLAAYRVALEAIEPGCRVELWLHFPLAGRVIRMEAPQAGDRTS